MKFISVIIELLWYSKIGLSQRWTNWYAPAIEKEHDPFRYTSTSSPFIEGTREKVPEPYESPDYRLEEPFYLPYAMGYYFEEERPYRISPHLKTTSRWGRVDILNSDIRKFLKIPVLLVHCFFQLNFLEGPYTSYYILWQLACIFVGASHRIFASNRIFIGWTNILSFIFTRTVIRAQSENIEYAGCYCTTVYKRLIPLAGCAVITTRHILTTATSTHLILRDRYHFATLENILGAWYDTNHNNYNSSMYLTPARIHYHPLWHFPEQVNRSHPFSFTFDLAVWATTYNVYGWYFNGASAIICLRATSHSSEHGSPAPTNELFIIVGFQYMLAYKRKPMPWYKYAVRTRKYTNPCPKTEWGWFICIPGDWAKYGIESGAALHRSFEGRSWRYDGLVAIAAFSMKLRSVELNHYFTILDHHYVLDFLFDAYESTITPKWLDARFNDSKYMAPRLKTGYYIPRLYPIGDQNYYLTLSDK